MPVAQEGGTTPMHLAARLGNLPALQLLLQVQPYCLDPVCMVDPDHGPAGGVSNGVKLPWGPSWLTCRVGKLHCKIPQACTS